MFAGQRRWSHGVRRLEACAKRLPERLDGLLSRRALAHHIRLEALRINASATALNPIRVADLDLLLVRHGSSSRGSGEATMMPNLGPSCVRELQ